MGSLFGNTQQQGSSIFGQSQQQRPSLFGSTASQPQTTNLFGSLGTQQQQQQQQQQTPSLFGSKPAQQATGLFGASTQQTANAFGVGASTQQQAQQARSIFSAQPSQTGSLTLVGGPKPQPTTIFGTPAQLPKSQIWSPAASTGPRDKTIAEQMQILLEKWHPDSPNCLFQHYFYNTVPPEQVPFYGPATGEDEKKWEEALAKKSHEGAIPVLAKGFTAIAERLKIQVQAVQCLQQRLHEINNSLNANMQKHDLETTVRAAEARRKHMALSQRCLALATKVQVLRNRGYVMDPTEEELKKKLVELERKACDPVLSGRQEEIWARMSGVRARVKLLQEESEKIGKKLASGEEETMDEDTMKKVKKILSDYDSQLSHLKKEIDQIQKDYQAWEGVAKPAAGTPVQRR